MTVDAFFFVQGNEPLTEFRDLDRVTILHAAVTDDGHTIPAGTEGIVVDVIRGGVAYAVEFVAPFGGLATVLGDGLRHLEEGDP